MSADVKAADLRRVHAIGRKLHALGVTQAVTGEGGRGIHVLFDDAVTGVYLLAGDHVGALQTGGDTIRVTGRNAMDIADDITATLGAAPRQGGKE